LSDVSRDTVKQYGVMDEDPNSAYFRLAKRAYVVIDHQGIVRHIEAMDDAGHLLDAETILNTVKKSVTGVQ
jgi:peroxiredoxin